MDCFFLIQFSESNKTFGIYSVKDEMFDIVLSAMVNCKPC